MDETPDETNFKPRDQIRIRFAREAARPSMGYRPVTGCTRTFPNERTINASYLQSYLCRSIIYEPCARRTAATAHWNISSWPLYNITSNNTPRQSSYRHHVYYRDVIKCFGVHPWPPPLFELSQRRNIPMIFISACQAGLAEGHGVTANRL